MAQQVSIQNALRLAIEHHQAGRLEQAEPIYRQILTASPNHPDALHLLGILFYQRSQFDPALELIPRAIALRPNDPLFHCNLGQVLTAAGRPDNAIATLQTALSLKPQYPEAYVNLSIALRAKGKLDESLVSVRRAISLQPNFALAHYNLGLTLRLAGQPDQSFAALRQSIALDPRSPETHNDLGIAFRDSGDLRQAILAFRNAVSLRPTFWEAQNNLGNALQENDQFEEAIAAHCKAISIRPDFVVALNNLATALQKTGQIDEAIETLRQALALPTINADPNAATLHYNLGMMLLLKGDYQSGWAEYEWRLKDKPLQPTQPRWDGTATHGTRILLYTEQGFGDAIHFVRYAPLVAQRGMQVILKCHPELVRLFRGIDEIEMVNANEDAIPKVDVQCPLMSLPMFFETIPAMVPYLRADSGLSSQWRNRLAKDRFKVGVAWAGSVEHLHDRFRSIDVNFIAQLVQQYPEIQFVSLQKNRSAHVDGVADWTDELNDFADTAALVDNLDLVLSIDSAVAHLAGAMGKQVWVLIPHIPDWRWMLGRDDSPWYPTMRLFRQPRFGDWNSPIQQIVQELFKLMRLE